MRVQQDVQVKGGRWTEDIPQGWRHKEKTGLIEERGKISKVHLAQWIGLEDRDKVHEEIQRKMRCLFGDRAQAEKAGNGGAVSSIKRLRRNGGLQRMQRESPMKHQAVRAVV